MKTGLMLTVALLLGCQAGWSQKLTESLRSTTTNDGLYSNRIADLTPPRAYTEVCLFGGSILVDLHDVSESAEGGNCEPGDIGWIIEREERVADTWVEAKADCLLDGMRLPEPFEWVFSCVRDGALGLTGLRSGSWEWVSNAAHPTQNQDEEGEPDRLQTGIMGDGSCDAMNGGLINSDLYGYRCVR